MTNELERDLPKAEALLAQGRAGDADRLCRRLARRAPENARLLLAAGIAAFMLGDFRRAAHALARHVAKEPGSLSGWINLGNAHHKGGEADKAAAALGRAAELAPESAAAHYNLGCALLDSDPAAAERALERAARLRPGHGPTWLNLSVALLRQARSAAAVEAAARAVELAPDRADFRLALANALSGAGRFEQAEGAYARALDLSPDLTEAAVGLARVLRRLRRPGEAWALMLRALERVPGRTDVLAMAIWAAVENNRPGEGIALIRPASAAAEEPGVRAALGSAWLAAGDAEAAARLFRPAPGTGPVEETLARLRVTALAYVQESGAPEMAEARRDWVERFARPLHPAKRPSRRSLAGGERLRVGFLGTTFRAHPVANNVLGILERRDPQAYEAIVYDAGAEGDEVTGRFRQAADGWRAVRALSDAEAADAIRADGIDVLVSLAGWVDENRPLIVAHAPAPVQVSWHDIASSGMDVVDYWLTDSVLHPPGTAELFTERLVRLPCFYWHAPIEDAPECKPPPMLESGRVTFASFNNPAKLSDTTLKLWARVLGAVPGARLVLKYKDRLADAFVRKHLEERFRAQGGDPSRLVALERTLARPDHLALYRDVDIALDTFPFNGSATTWEALYMGVPVISRTGGTFLSRVGASVLGQAGLADLAAGDDETFVAAAAGLAADSGRLAALRGQLRPRLLASPLADATAHARAFEAALLATWRDEV